MEFACSYIDIGDAHLLPIGNDSHKVVVRLPLQQPRLNHSARGYNTNNVPLHQPLCFGLAELLADGDLMSLVYQPRQIVIQGMTRDPRHRDALPLAHLPGGQHDLQLPGGDPGILVEGLVEVAEAEEDDRFRILPLYPKVLLS